MRESEEEAALLGRIAVRYGFITMDQLAEATRERGRGGKKLGAIMLERGMINELDLGKVLALQKRQRATTQRRQAPTQTARPRIPTPIDWAFDPASLGLEEEPEPEPDAAGERREMPRRGRRTDDVVRARLATEMVPPATTPPSAALDSSVEPTPPARPEPPPNRPAAARPVPPRVATARPAPARVAPPPPEEDSAVEFELDIDPAPRGIAAPSHEKPTPPEGRGRAPAPRAPPQPPPMDPRGRAVTARGMAPEMVMQPPPSAAQPSAAQPSVGPASLVQAPLSVPVETPTEPSPASELAKPPPRVQPVEAARVEPLPWDPPPLVRSVEFLHKILGYAVGAEASDVHVHACVVAKMRQFGRLVPITESPCSPTATHAALTSILTPYQRRRFEEDGEIDFAYAVDGLGRFRANIYRQQHGTNGVFHVIAREPPTLAALGLPDTLAKLTNYTQGLILLTGPAGCGKTSTLAALADIINEERHDHILTIEDPIEYVYASKRCVVNQRQVGRHTESFASGLRGALREDPDIICIGELRDLETISLALSAAETGHLVLATLHTGSAVGTVNRIVGAYPPGQQPQVRAMMSESLRAITSQRLLPTADGNEVVPVLEVLFVTRPVAALIRDNRTFQIPSIMQTGRSQGMRLMDESIRELLIAKRISREVALVNCEDRRKVEGV